MSAVCFSDNMFLDPLVSQDEGHIMPTGQENWLHFYTWRGYLKKQCRLLGSLVSIELVRSNYLVPTDTVPTDTVPTDTVPTDTVPTDTVPTDDVNHHCTEDDSCNLNVLVWPTENQLYNDIPPH